VEVEAKHKGTLKLENKGKSRERLSQELTRLRQRVVELEASEIERKRTEEKLDHLNAVLRAIRNVNQFIAQEQDRGRLLQGICDSLVETRSYHSAWIALLEGSGKLAASAETGLGEAFLPMTEWLKRSELPECVRRALGRSEVVVVKGPAVTCSDCPLVDSCGDEGVMTIRLEHGGIIYGVLSASISRELVAGEEGWALFREVAGDIAFALHDIELEEERVRVQEEVRQLSQFRESIINNAHMWLNVLDRKGNVVIWNKVAEDLSGYSSKEVVGHGKIWGWLYPDEVYRRKIEAKLEGILERGEVLEGFETTIRCKDGRSRIISWNERNLSDRDGKVSGSIALGQDVTEHRRLERKIKERQLYLEEVLAAVPDALITLDSSCRIVEWSSGAERLFGYSRDDVIGGNIDDLIAAPDVSEEAVGITRLPMSGKEVPPTEAVRYRKDGRPVNVILAGSPVWLGDKVIGSVAAYTDITERVHAERELQGSTQKIERLHEVARQLETCMGEDEVYRLTIEAAERTLSFSVCTLDIVEEDKLVVKATSSAVPPEARGETTLEKGGLAAKTYRTKETIVFGSIDEVPEATPVRTDIRSGISAPIGDIGVFQVISTEPDAFTKNDARMVDLLLGHTYEAIRRIHLQEDLKDQAIHDPLTGAYNRRYFNERIEEELKRSRRYEHPVGFLMMDVDRFKEINDRFGHQMGDRVLQEVAKLLQEQVRTNDLVIRYGGDEFLVVLLETDGGTEVIKERITEAVVKYNETNPLLKFPVRLSIGDAYWGPDEKRAIEEVLAEADRRMYKEKEQQHES